MSSIIGENLDENLTKQINVRQEKLGKPFLDPDDIIYNNSGTSWLRVASSVNIDDVDLAGLGDFTAVGEGNRFAKSAVLFGATVDDKGTLPLEALNSSQILNEQTQAQYGWGGNHSKWGYTPRVESLNISALNRGAIRKASISIVAHNPDQFRLIEALYLRLGFTILVEWGHTTYYDNEGALQQRNDFATPPFDTFMGGSGDNVFNTVTKELITEREDTAYNYDGFIGYISNFNWKFNPNGSYNITLDVISRGGLIDSLKTNYTMNKNAIPKDGQGKDIAEAQVLTSLIQSWKNALKSDATLSNTKNQGTQFESQWYYSAASDYESPDGIENCERYGFDLVKDGELFRYPMQSMDEGFARSNQYFITLGAFLRVIKEKSILYSDNGDPIVDINHNYGETFYLKHPFQNSVDPTVCCLTSANPKIGTPDMWPGTYPEALLEGLDLGEVEDKSNPFKGDMMNILINMDFIISQINSVTENGNVPLGPLDGVANVTGNINSFNVTYEEEINTLSIKDDTSIPGVTPIRNTVAKIQIYGITPNETTEDGFPNLGKGSFVKTLGFTSKIFPSLQNAIAIAAQNPGTSTGDQVSSYQRLNKGLMDRVSRGAKPFYKTGEKNPFLSFRPEIVKLIKHFSLCWNRMSLPKREKINDMATPLKDILSYDLQWRASKGEITSPFFIPVELSLTLKGISGFKLYEKFDIGPDYILPSSYPDNINFIIQGVSHDLKDNEWTTSLKCLSWPAEKGEVITDFGDIIKGQDDEVIPESETPTPPARQPDWRDWRQNTGFPDLPTPFVPGDNPLNVQNPNRPPELWWGDAYSTKRNFGIKPFTPTTISEVTTTINKKIIPYIIQFLTNILAEPRLNGVKVSINSAARTYTDQGGVQKTSSGVAATPGSSPHQYGCALDITLVDIETGRRLRNNDNTPEQWVVSGMVDCANRAKMSSWGATFGRYDPLHFGMKFSLSKAQKEAKRYAAELGKDWTELTGEEIRNLDVSIYPGINNWSKENQT